MLGDIIVEFAADLVGDALGSFVEKHWRKSLVLCAALAMPVLAPVASAQQVPTPAPVATPALTAQIVAARVQTFYDQTTSVEARFQQHFWNRVYARTQSSSGRLVIQRPGRVRFNYDQPRGKVVVSTPAGFVFYEPNEDGSPGQFLRGTSDAASSALGFLSGTARLDRDFRLSLRAPVAGQPPNTDALELRPRRSDPSFRRIVLYVDNRTQSLGVVRRVAIEDPDGNWNRFDFSDFQFDHAVSASTFNFTPPAGAHEINAPTATPAPPTVGPATPAH
jgi:outer membrane lipoprotein carrier protein